MGLETNGGGRGVGGGSGLPPGASYEDEPPIDLSLLATPRRGQGRGPTDWEALAARIERAAEPELARRARAASGILDFMPVLARSLRPALVAAAAALVLAVGLVPREVPVESVEVATGPLVRDAVAHQLLSDASDASGGRAIPATSDAVWIAQLQAPSANALAEAVGLGELP